MIASVCLCVIKYHKSIYFFSFATIGQSNDADDDDGANSGRYLNGFPIRPFNNLTKLIFFHPIAGSA